MLAQLEYYPTLQSTGWVSVEAGHIVRVFQHYALVLLHHVLPEFFEAVPDLVGISTRPIDNHDRYHSDLPESSQPMLALLDLRLLVAPSQAFAPLCRSLVGRGFSLRRLNPEKTFAELDVLAEAVVKLAQRIHRRKTEHLGFDELSSQLIAKFEKYMMIAGPLVKPLAKQFTTDNEPLTAAFLKNLPFMNDVSGVALPMDHDDGSGSEYDPDAEPAAAADSAEEDDTEAPSDSDTDSAPTRKKKPKAKKLKPDQVAAMVAAADQQQTKAANREAKAADFEAVASSGSLVLSALASVDENRRKEKQNRQVAVVEPEVRLGLSNEQLANERNKSLMPLSVYRFADEVLTLTKRFQRPLDEGKVSFILQQTVFNPDHLTPPGAVVYVGDRRDVAHLLEKGNVLKAGLSDEEVETAQARYAHVECPDPSLLELCGQFLIVGGQHNYASRQRVALLKDEDLKRRIKRAKPYFEAYFWCIPPVSFFFLLFSF